MFWCGYIEILVPFSVGLNGNSRPISPIGDMMRMRLILSAPRHGTEIVDVTLNGTRQK